MSVRLDSFRRGRLGTGGTAAAGFGQRGPGYITGEHDETESGYPDYHLPHDGSELLVADQDANVISGVQSYECKTRLYNTTHWVYPGEVKHYIFDRAAGAWTLAYTYAPPFDYFWSYRAILPGPAGYWLYPKSTYYGNNLHPSVGDSLAVVVECTWFDPACEISLPTCALGTWAPSDPPSDLEPIVYNSVNPFLDQDCVRTGYHILTRAALGDQFTPLSDELYAVWEDYVCPRLNEATGKLWTWDEGDTDTKLRVYDMDDDPQSASYTTLTLPSGTRTGIRFDGALTILRTSTDRVYVYDGTTLVQTINPGHGITKWDVGHGWLLYYSTDTGLSYFLKRDGNTFVLHSTLPVESGHYMAGPRCAVRRTWYEDKLVYSPQRDEWSTHPWPAGRVLGDIGWSTEEIFDNAMLWTDDNAIAIAYL